MYQEKKSFLRKISCYAVLLFALSSFAQEQKPDLNFYGFVRNDFYYNSRQNDESMDGVFHIAPKPVIQEGGKDKNAVSEAEMLSVSTRVGLDVEGADMFGAKISAKIEADFAGSGSSYFVLRLRQAYTKFDWTKSELLIGQTWHPLFGSVFPDVISINTGSPFQPFNRSPQVRYVYKLNDVFSLSAAAVYQMQYTSQGPNGASTTYMKQAVVPDLFVGIENKTKHWTSGAGFDTKTIKPVIDASITSLSAMVYTQYVDSKFQFRLKGLWGQNMSDYLLMNGYGVSQIDENTGKETGYTNFDIFTSWLNIVYGSKWRVGLYAGFSQNLGTNKDLVEVGGVGEFAVYSRGFYKDQQLFSDQVYRASVYVSHNLPRFSFGAEYNFTAVQYGKLQRDGRTNENTWVNNYRIAANVVYHF